MKYTSKTVLSMLLFLLMSIVIYAGDPVSGLVITEVLLDDNNPQNSWIEIYNPTEKNLYLERFRLSHIRTINVLQRNNRDFKVKPKEIIILCANLKKFEQMYGKMKIKVIEVEALSMFTDGGFIALATKNNPETGGDVVRYGLPERSLSIQSIVGNNVIQFSEQKSYSRKIVVTAYGKHLSEFEQLDPTPGLLNN